MTEEAKMKVVAQEMADCIAGMIGSGEKRAWSVAAIARRLEIKFGPGVITEDFVGECFRQLGSQLRGNDGD
jgi:hypothetical protein